jgi:glucokinase
MTLAIGIDLGGTKIAGGLVDPATGLVTARMVEPTEAGQGGAAVLDRVERMARALLSRAAGPVIGLGLGVPELVDRDGNLFSGYRIDWRGLNPAARLSRLIPTRIEADVRAAALAEVRLGAARGLSDVLYVTIGTGVSCVAVLDGRPYPGSRGAALVMANGLSRQIGEDGAESRFVLEDVASGPGLVAAYRAGGGRAARAEDVLAATDALSARVIDLAALRLGQALALLAGALDPAAIILGGGLGSAPGRYFDAIARHLGLGLWADDARPLPVLRAALGPDAGLIGAALTVADHLSTQRPDHRPATAHH